MNTAVAVVAALALLLIVAGERISQRIARTRIQSHEGDQ